MRIDYIAVIRESEKELEVLERKLWGQPAAIRVRMLRWLKSGKVKSLNDCAQWLEYSLRQLTRWWERYKEGGLDALIETRPRLGKPSRLTPEAWAGLQEELQTGRIGSLEEARQYLKRHWQIEYGSVNGIWWMLNKSGEKGKPEPRWNSSESD